jgi:uncharacterized protein (DUF736 family)
LERAKGFHEAAQIVLVRMEKWSWLKAWAMVFAGRSRIGEAWEARTGGLSPKDYLKVKLDDPMLAEPIDAAMLASEGRRSAQRRWSRRRRKE